MIISARRPRATWEILKDASVFLLLRLSARRGAGGPGAPRRLLTRLGRDRKVKSVLWGSVLGSPLPLCSCGVLPTALGLRRQGATPGATVAFLVATPETGVDSISLTYALTDPIMTVFRPIAGVVTAIAAGLATNLFGAPRPARRRPADGPLRSPPEDRDSGPVSAADDERCGLASRCTDGTDHGTGRPRRGRIAARLRSKAASLGAAVDAEKADHPLWLRRAPRRRRLVARTRNIPVRRRAKSQFRRTCSRARGAADWLRCCSMLVLSIPLYTCASSSTPMAAALALKGLSPGPILVFLLAGPATNIGSLVVLLKVLGRRAVAVYLAAVVIVTLAAGFALNALYHALGARPPCDVRYRRRVRPGCCEGRPAPCC